MENIDNISEEEAKAAELETINKEIEIITSGLGDPAECEDALWWMLYYSLSNPDNMVDTKTNEKALFVYHMSIQLIKLMNRAYQLRR